MKKILVVGTSATTVPIYDYLSSEDHEVWSLGGNPSDPIPAQYPDRYINANYKDISTALDAIDRSGICFNAIVPGPNDYAFECAFAIQNKYAVRTGFQPLLSSYLFNKLAYRKLLQESEIPQPAFLDPQNLYTSSYGTHLFDQTSTCLIKPTKSFSGIGIQLTTVENALSSFVYDSILEEYIEGSLHSCSLFVDSSGNHRSFIVDESVEDSFFVKYSRYPSLLSPRIQENIISVCNQIRSILPGLPTFLHTQFIVKDDRIYAIESMSRCPGDHFPKLIEYSSLFNYTKYYCSSWLDDSFSTSSDLTLRDPIPCVRQTIGWSEMKSIKDYHPRPLETHAEVKFYKTCGHDENLAPLPEGKWGIGFTLNDAKAYNNFENQFWQ